MKPESAILLRMNRRPKIIRPIQFDAARLARRRSRARAARMRRIVHRNRMWWAVIALLPSPNEISWFVEVIGADNDNINIET